MSTSAADLPGIDRLGDLRGRRVLVRSDLNVPMDGQTITDDGRIRASLPTWRQLMDAGARVVVCAHLGRPKGAPEDRYSLRAVAAHAGGLLEGRDLAFAADTVGPDAKAAVDRLEDGHAVLLENLRFNAGETSKDDAERGAFADELAALTDAYVSDGFGAVHRKHASVVDVPSGSRTRSATWSARRSRCSSGSTATHSARTSWCLAERRFRTSSA